MFKQRWRKIFNISYFIKRLSALTFELLIKFFSVCTLFFFPIVIIISDRFCSFSVDIVWSIPCAEIFLKKVIIHLSTHILQVVKIFFLILTFFIEVFVF